MQCRHTHGLHRRVKFLCGRRAGYRTLSTPPESRGSMIRPTETRTNPALDRIDTSHGKPHESIHRAAPTVRLPFHPAGTKIVPHLLCFALSILFLYHTSLASPPHTFLFGLVKRAEKLFVQCAGDPRIRMKELAPAQALLDSLTSATSLFHSIIRTNSRAVVVNEAVRSGPPGERYRGVAAEPWYRAVEKGGEPYYGPPIREKGFAGWEQAIPIFVHTAEEGRRFGGALMCRIDAARCVALTTARLGTPVQILHGGRTLAGAVNASNGRVVTKPAALRGDDGYTVRYGIAWSDRKKVEAAGGTAVSGDGSAERLVGSDHMPGNQPTRVPPAASSNNRGSHRTRPRLLDMLISYRYVLTTIAALAALFILITMIVRTLGRGKGTPVPRGGPMEQPKLNSKGTITVEADDEDTADFIVDEEKRQSIVEQESENVRRAVLNDIYGEIRNQIVRQESRKMYEEVRRGLEDDLRHRLEASESESIRQRLRGELTSVLEDELREEIRRELRASRDELAAEERERLRKEIAEEVREGSYEEIRDEAYANLEKNVQARVRLENEKELADRAVEKLAAAMSERVQREQSSELEHAAREEFKRAHAASLTDEQREGLEQEALAALRGEIRDRTEQQHRERVEREERDVLRAEIAAEIRSNESSAIADRLREDLREELREGIHRDEYGSLYEQEKETVRSDIVAILQNNEYAQMVETERERLGAEIRARLAELETEKLTDEIRNEIKGNIRESIRSNEIDAITARMRAEFTSVVRNELRERERDSLREKVREELMKELRGKLEATEKDAICARLVAEIEQREHTRIEEEVRPGIVARERMRILEEEAPRLRTEIRSQLYKEEKEALRAAVQEEIYEDTVADIEKNAAKRIEEGLGENRQAELQSIREQMAAEQNKRFEGELGELLQLLSETSRSADDFPAMESFRQTVAKLKEEKNRRGCCSLDEQRAEKLVTYLAHVTNDFDAFLERLESTSQSAIIQINSILNALKEP